MIEEKKETLKNTKGNHTGLRGPNERLNQFKLF